MSYKIVHTTQFRKDYKLMMKRWKDKKKLERSSAYWPMEASFLQRNVTMLLQATMRGSVSAI